MSEYETWYFGPEGALSRTAREGQTYGPVIDADAISPPTVWTHALIGGGVVHLKGNPTPEAECELCQTGSESWPIGDSGWVGTIAVGPPTEG